MVRATILSKLGALKPVVVSRSAARAALVSHLGLSRFTLGRSADAVAKTLAALTCIQLDPLDRIGQNADLVVMARVARARRGDPYRALFPGVAFEHFAKERCLLPASAFPNYRDRAVEAPWWRHAERSTRVSSSLVEEVLREIDEKGPVTVRELEHRGSVEPIDWSGWRGTSSATKVAVEVLWTRCEVVVAGKRGRDKIYDVPRRALAGVHAEKAAPDFERWALGERIRAAGMLALSAGPWWSMLGHVRKGPVPRALVEDGLAIAVRVEDRPRIYLAPPDLFEKKPVAPDGATRILGPLDALVWDRVLVQDVFGFDYVWEVYKPEADRRWGYYVCPLLFGGELVGRIEAHVEGATFVVDALFRERGRDLDRAALGEALERHALACGCDRVVGRGRRALVQRSK